MPEEMWISPWETMALNCYAMRYPHLLGGFCGGKAEIKRTEDMRMAIETCNYQGLLAHWRDHGSKDGLNRECADASVKCYAMANPDLVGAFCPGGYQACDWTKLDLLKHYALYGHKEGRVLACDSPAARCYVQRNPELRASLCSGNVEQCNWMSLHEHYLQNPVADQREGMICEAEPAGAEKKPHANANDQAPHDSHSPASGDAAKEQAFVLRLSMTAHSCKLDAFVNEPQCKARAAATAIKREKDPEQKLVLVAQLAATKTATTPQEKHLELQAAKRMYAAYCVASPPPAEPAICTNEILKKGLGGPAEMVPFEKG